MKKLERVKTIELLVLMAFSFLCFYLVILHSNIYHDIATNPNLQLLCVLLWITMFSSFLFVFIDFSLYSKQKNDFNALDYAVHSDSLAKIANRQGIDDLIEKYIDEPLPKNLGCMMILLVSLNEVNKRSRSEGNAQIRNFSIILKLASTDICFVGRNGGNVFMAIFEDTTQEKINNFVSRIEEKVIENNEKSDVAPMYYRFGIGFNEGPEIESINGLISLANQRAQKSLIVPIEMRNRIKDNYFAEQTKYNNIVNFTPQPKALPAVVVNAETKEATDEMTTAEEKTNEVPEKTNTTKTKDSVSKKPNNTKKDTKVSKENSNVDKKNKNKEIRKDKESNKKNKTKNSTDKKEKKGTIIKDKKVEKIEKTKEAKKAESIKKPKNIEPKDYKGNSSSPKSSYKYTTEEINAIDCSDDGYNYKGYREAV